MKVDFLRNFKSIVSVFFKGAIQHFNSVLFLV